MLCTLELFVQFNGQSDTCIVFIRVVDMILSRSRKLCFPFFQIVFLLISPYCFPNSFLKQIVSSGEWFEVSDEVAKEKASQCLRDIVAAQTTGVGRKRAFQSAPELVASVNKRQRSLLQPDVPVGERQNATFNLAQLRMSGGPAPSNPFLGANNPFLAMMGGAGSRGPTSSTTMTRPLPPKAISCVSLGAAHRTQSSLTPSSNRSRGSHQDPLLRQLQLLRAQQQQNAMLQPQQQSSANALFPLPMMQPQQPPPAIISQSNMMMQAQPTLPSRNFGTANATWDLLPRSSLLSTSREPPTEPMPFQTTSTSSSGIASTTTTNVPANTMGGTNGIDMTDEDAALKRWIDRLAEEDF
jgi:hypothetical protein